MIKIHRFLIPLFVLAFLLVGCSRDGTNGTNTSSDSSANMSTGKFSFDGTILTGKHTVVLKTTKGNIAVELDADAAPKTVTNFVTLSKSGYFDGLTFHRVIPSFMIQGGDPNGNGTGGESVFGETFEDEINADSYKLNEKKIADLAEGQEVPEEWKNMTLKEYYQSQGYTYNDALQSLPMVRGALAMANRGPNSNGSQFFIVQGENISWLEGKYTVFGKVTEGMDVVDAIAGVERDENNKPLEPVTFTAEAQD